MTRGDAVEEMVAGLGRAVDRGEMRVHFLPTVSLGDGSVVGVEALARWQRGDRLLDTWEYLQVAEKTGHIVRIGRWVMDRACREVAAWNAEHLERPPLRLAVNVSLHQLTEPYAVGRVEEVLEATSFEPALLSLEVSQDALHEMGQAAGSTLLALKRLGVRVSVDDFGTGASSLVALQRYHLDEIKIDRSFVQQMDHDDDAAAIVRGVARLAQSFGLETVAEGVERTAQEQMLHALGCGAAQGWLYAKPAEDLAQAVEAAAESASRSMERKPVEHSELWESMPTSQTAARFVEAVFETAPIGMALIDETGRHVAANPAASQLLGHGVPELLEMTCWELVHPADLQADLAGMDALLTGELSTYVVEERIASPDGRTHWVEITVSGVPGEHQAHGAPARLLRQIRSIEEIRQSRESAAVLHSVFATSPDAVIIIDPLGRCTHWNAAAEQLFGYPKAAMVGAPLTKLVGPGAQLRMARVLAEAAAGASVRWPDAVWLDISGRDCAVDVTVGPIEDDSGHRIGLLAIARDVTDERAAAVALSQAHEALGFHASELGAVNVRLATFAGTLVHDLRQPLTGTSGYLELLSQHATEMTAEHRYWLASALRSTSRLNEAIDALHRNAVEESLHLVPIDLGDLVAQLLPDLVAELGEAEVTVDQLPTVSGDRGFVTQVLANLLQNAGRYRDPERPLRIRIEARREGLAWVVSVEDSGRGISTDELESVFEPGARGRSSAGTAGTGTGLATIRTLMHRMGGAVWAEPVPSGGVRMCLRFE